MSAPLCTTSRTSRALSFYIFLWILVSGFWTLPASAQPIGLNEDSRVVTLPTGEKVFEWYGQTGRSYFVQVSDPSDHLNKWNWAPVIEPGYNQSISHEVDATANKGFFRLQYTNQTASDLDNADFDGDGLTNLQEITPVLRPGTRAARSIIGGPLPPNTTQTNPLDPDTDHDGLTDFDEQLNGTDPTMADTDGGGSTDGDEVARGSNPNESGDDDHPPTDQVKDIDFKVYGDYASWIMHIEGLGPRDTRKLAIASPDVGIPATKPVKLWSEADPKVRPRKG